MQALQLIEEQSFDLILLDVRMPGIDGIEVARRIRRREQERGLSPVSIVVITAEADAATREACLGAGINAVLSKPINSVQLGQAIAAYCTTTDSAPDGAELLLNAQINKDLGGNPERSRQFQEMLLQDIDDEVRCLRIALESENRLDLGRAAHTLKGLCGHLARQEASELAAWLQHNAESAPVDQLWTAVEKLVTTVRSRG